MKRICVWLTLCSLSLLAAACGSGADILQQGRARVAAGPGTDKADGAGADVADRSCRVVLRQVGRQPAGDGGFETAGDGGAGNYVWRGRVDVTGELAGQGQVFVLYHLAGDAQWYEVPALGVSSPVPGYQGFAFAMHEHLFGPDTPAPLPAIELVPYLLLADGTRLFAHNVQAGDFENTVLDEGNYFSSGAGENTCRPPLGTLRFNADWSIHGDGRLRAGGYLEIFYDIDRLPQCRGTHNGYPAWDIDAYVRFSPGGQEFSGSVTRNGAPPLLVQIPEDAEQVEIWFLNYTGAGGTCRAWDSNYGANYHFDVWPPADDPRCRDVQRDNPDLHGEDYRMPHNEPYCLGYELSANYNASFCEFHLQGLGQAHLGHYGIPFDWLLAYLRIGPVEGEVLAAGMFSRFHNDDGTGGVSYTLGTEESDGLWRVGFVTLQTGYQGEGGIERSLDEFAFFIDVRRPHGQVVRLWQSRGGSNYTIEDAFSLPPGSESIPYGNIQWANPASAVFDSRRACGY